MKRSVASKVLQRKNVCFFCAFRSRGEPFHLAASRCQASRSYVSTAPRYQAPAAQEKDDNEGEFAMLKRNAALAFPTKKPSPPPLQASAPASQHTKTGTPSAARQRSNLQTASAPSQLPIRRHPVRNDNDRNGRSNRNATTKSNESSEGFTRRYSPVGGSDGQRRHQPGSRNRTNTAGNNQSFYNRDALDSNQSVEYKPRQFTERQPIPSQNREEEQDSFVVRRIEADGGSNPLVRRSTTSDTYEDYTPLNGQRGGTRFPNHPQSSTRQNSNDTYNGNRSTDSRREQLNEGDTADAADNVSDDLLDIGNVEAPAGSSFDHFGSHHRHQGRKAHRSRNDRFADDEDDDSYGKRAMPVKTSRRGVQGRGFDFEMAEVEEQLYGSGRKKKGKAQKEEKSVEQRATLILPEFVSVERLARMLKVDLEKFLSQLEEEGFEGARYDHVLDFGTSSMFAELHGFEPQATGSGAIEDLVARPLPEDTSILPARPPIVTIMGHVDHGKTTILDYLRKSSVVATEHGGITQHIGAFSVQMPGSNRQITFLDTPGHAAFLEMRRRGANVTDIVVLVVAADDSVKPQTIEAIKHAREAGVQIIVAINKVDKPDADTERVKQDLTRHEIVVEEYGGDYQAIALSGKTGQGMSELEEAIVTLADVYDFRAEADGMAEGWVIESKVTNAGRVATVLVRRGTLRPGDFIVAGTTWARVRTLRNDGGQLVSEAPPGTPVQVDGWRGEDPTAGLEVLQADNEDHAKSVVDLRLEQREVMKATTDIAKMNIAKSEEAEARARVLAWESEQAWAKRGHKQRPKDNEGWVEQAETEGPKRVHFVIKADVAGSVEALVAAVGAIGNGEVAANVIHSGTGQVTESDIKMLAATGEEGFAISFNQPLEMSAMRLAEAAGLEIMDYNIIYKVTDVVKEKLAEHLPPIINQRVLGEAEVGQIFDITIKKEKVKIAGCRVGNGTISRSNKVRVSRNGEVVFTGMLNSLKNVKKDVTEMRKGTECGLGFVDWQDFEIGDQVQCFEETEEKRKFY